MASVYEKQLEERVEQLEKQLQESEKSKVRDFELLKTKLKEWAESCDSNSNYIDSSKMLTSKMLSGVILADMEDEELIEARDKLKEAIKKSEEHMFDYKTIKVNYSKIKNAYQNPGYLILSSKKSNLR